MKSGEREVPWWSRPLPSLPFKAIAVVVGIVLVAGFAYLYLGPALGAWVWGVRNHSTATYEGIGVKVPWMWRLDETPVGQRQLRLVRARFGKPVEFESIVISDGRSTLGTQSLTERFQVLEAKLGQKGFQGTPITLDPETAKSFTCIAPHIDKLEWQASCLSIDSRLAVDLFGPDADMDSFEFVLRGLSAQVR